MLAVKMFFIACALAAQGHVAAWCLVCGEMVGAHEYAYCACERVCVCDCLECDDRPAHMEADHDDCKEE